jgi:hypothetical protein
MSLLAAAARRCSLSPVALAIRRRPYAHLRLSPAHSHATRPRTPAALPAALRCYTTPTSPPADTAPPADTTTPPAHTTSQYVVSAITNKAIIIPASVAAATPDSLIAHIRPIAPESCLRDSFALFFVTPAFAHWLLDDSIFLSKALDHLYQHLHPRAHAKLTALCAVVDKLPAAHALPRDAAQPTCAPETGFEGIAYATMAKPLHHPRPKLHCDPGQPFIQFVAQPAGPRHRLKTATVLQFPLANTVFQTGRPNTMIHSTWNKKAGAPATLELTHEPASWEIKLNEKTGSATTELQPTLVTPLIPLTFPRTVDGHMGNILRQVVGEGGESMQASTELEHAVPAFFKARGELVQSTSAWALVIPKKMTPFAAQRTREAITQAQDVTDEVTDWGPLWNKYWSNESIKGSAFQGHSLVDWALLYGARLHRVLSGGGGWGKKAGLLSLDPGPLPAPDSTQSSDAGAAFADEADFTSALRTVVNEGDSIQFFVSPPASSDVRIEDLETLKQSQLLSADGAWDWEFGVVPSTVDSVPGASWQHASVESDEVIVFRDTFGALAERGLTWCRRPAVGRAPHTKPVPTTVDVPFARFAAYTRPAGPRNVKQSSGKSVDEDADENVDKTSDKNVDKTSDKNVGKSVGKKVGKMLGTKPVGLVRLVPV